MTVAPGGDLLGTASAGVADLLALLRSLAAQARQRADQAAAGARQLAQALDELKLQRDVAARLAGPLLDQLRAREGELRQRHAALQAETSAAGEAQRRLELLLRQIEMSSAVLAGRSAEDEADPWLLALKAQIIKGREEERLRLAREVHDGTAQVVANVLMGLDHATRLHQAQSAHLAPFLDELHGAARSGLDEVRRFIADLRPGAIGELGGRGAIGEYARAFAARSGLHITVELAEWPRAMPEETEIVLYRIVQEALQNINKHARQAHVLVRSLFRQHTLTLTIRDDGPGFDPREVARRSGRESWGLTSMRERAALVGGRFSIASRPGAGVEVVVSLPVRD